jgi:hypothetical protein
MRTMGIIIRWWGRAWREGGTVQSNLQPLCANASGIL